MPKHMLIDATHLEETRVAIVQDQQLEDFDFESSTKRQLKGNIYLAKITRVEPSLQAAFVDYGSGRHGFLAFSEIHSDYYQIPQADRELLEQLEQASIDAANDAEAAETADMDLAEAPSDDSPEASIDDGFEPPTAEAGDAEAPPVDAANGDGLDNGAMPEAAVEVTSGRSSGSADDDTADVIDAYARRRARLLRGYKIQEVIKRRQIILVQVVKEERGTKGAALTTYLSLAGRYCVLMPNTPRGGGISRKISVPADRRRLKNIFADLDVPTGMGLIIRTAGQKRSKAEIRRDYDYLLRLWSDIRERTLESIAPTPIHEEASLIKRALRDLYSRDIDEVLVEGEAGYRTAKRYMNMLMPSHARRIKQYRDELPLFFQHRIEDQLDLMYRPVVDLKSGGSIVIHTTEALTAIDVNSGRSTRERHIDDTALKTNLEASDAIARHMRLRDIAGLVVIDFIDMGEGRHQRAVERRLRDALKLDRARIQVGRISSFGLLELSRQRLRPSLQELSSHACPMCAGTGMIRSTESSALQALRAIEAEGVKGKAARVTLTLPTDVALYILNQKRLALGALEQRSGMHVMLHVDGTMQPPDFKLETTELRQSDDVSETAEEAPVERPQAAEVGDDSTGRKRRRRRRRKRRPDEIETTAADAVAAEEQASEPDAQASGEVEVTAGAEANDGASEATDADPAPQAAGNGAEDGIERPRRRRRRRTPRSRGRRSESADRPAPEAVVSGEQSPQPLLTPAEGGPQPDIVRSAEKRDQSEPVLVVEPVPEPVLVVETAEMAPPALAESGPGEQHELADWTGTIKPVDVGSDSENGEMPVAAPRDQPVPAEALVSEPASKIDEVADAGATVSPVVPADDDAAAAPPPAAAAEATPARQGWWSRWVHK